MTKAVFLELERRAQALRVALGNSAGGEPIEDSRKSGYVLAYQDIVDIDFEETQNDN